MCAQAKKSPHHHRRSSRPNRPHKAHKAHTSTRSPTLRRPRGIPRKVTRPSNVSKSRSEITPGHASDTHPRAPGRSFFGTGVHLHTRIASRRCDPPPLPSEVRVGSGDFRRGRTGLRTLEGGRRAKSRISRVAREHRGHAGRACVCVCGCPGAVTQGTARWWWV